MRAMASGRMKYIDEAGGAGRRAMTAKRGCGNARGRGRMCAPRRMAGLQADGGGITARAVSSYSWFVRVRCRMGDLPGESMACLATWRNGS